MRKWIVALFLALASSAALAQQTPDMDADLTVSRPLHVRGQGPVVAIDAGHNNFHTAEGRYAPFAEVLRNDGYQVRSLAAELTAPALAPLRVLVVSNALAKENVVEWRLPTPPAFTPAEIEAVREWVRGGGALFLIADHMPFPGAMASLASAFGFTLDNSVAVPSPRRAELFSRANGDLLDSEIVRGDVAGVPVTEVRTFGGSSFRAPPEAVPIMRLGSDWTIVFPEEWGVISAVTPRRPSTGEDLRAAALEFGKGRVVVVSEAAAFSAQAAPGGPMGFRADGAGQNKQFLLNVMHWLSQGAAEAR
ncbi:DUF4350 domain-containing protein [Phenylobacterium zucineum]|nr:DUF4350 domain-containing protein [Phenylobacterium zucineum]